MKIRNIYQTYVKILKFKKTMFKISIFDKCVEKLFFDHVSIIENLKKKKHEEIFRFVYQRIVNFDLYDDQTCYSKKKFFEHQRQIRKQ